MPSFSKKGCLRSILFIILPITALFCALKLVDNRVMPAAEQMASSCACAYVNKKIDEITSDLIAEKNLDYTDFYEVTEKDGEISQITINSLLVNDVCQKTASGLSQELNKCQSFRLTLPLGLVTGLKIFSNSGPKIRVKLVPAGMAEADCHTSVSDSGINRVNYQIYLNIKSSVNLVCPFYNKPLVITRKYMLVDTVFTGEVPHVYYNIEGAGNKSAENIIPYIRGDDYADLQSEGG